MTYSPVHKCLPKTSCTENLGNHKNFDEYDVSYKQVAFFTEMKQKENSKWPTLKIQNGRLKKPSFSISANSQYFLMKFSWIGPWLSSIA